jgi:hypothetical protein
MLTLRYGTLLTDKKIAAVALKLPDYLKLE